MFMPTTDYSQQMFAYLQTWRQLLEQWMNMTAGFPFPSVPPMPTAPPAGQFMPPIPPAPQLPMMPPAPADYTQQLFGYLQAWRQYLEQMTGGVPGSPSAAQPVYTAGNRPIDYGGQPHPNYGGQSPPQDEHIPPDDPTGTKEFQGSHSGSGSKQSLMDLAPGSEGESVHVTWPPPGMTLTATAEGESMVPPETRLASASRRFNSRPEGPEALKPPAIEFGNQIDRFRHSAEVSGPAGSPFASVMRRVAPDQVAQAAPKSLLSSPARRRQGVGDLRLPPARGQSGSK